MKKGTIVIIDYGVGNVRSVANVLAFLGYPSAISRDTNDIQRADSLILPGVGAFGEGMGNLKKFGLTDALNEAVLIQKKPILGICLGMQLLADVGEEGGVYRGLGYIPGRVVKFSDKKTPRIPHVGWNTIVMRKRKPLFERNEQSVNFYFDHSYYFDCQKKYILASCTYGITFAAMVGAGNVYGVQFHPEKSQTSGLKLLRSFFSRYYTH